MSQDYQFGPEHFLQGDFSVGPSPEFGESGQLPSVDVRLTMPWDPTSLTRKDARKRMIVESRKLIDAELKTITSQVDELGYTFDRHPTTFVTPSGFSGMCESSSSHSDIFHSA